MASTFIKLPPDTAVSPGSVDSFNGRTGVVVSQAGDYSAALISNTPAGNIAATDVQAAINELDTEKQGTITGGASTITTANLTASRALQSSAGGKVEVSAVTSTELGHVSGVTSAIQTQLNTLTSTKQPLDATLTSLAAYNTNGLLTQTAADTFTGRTITGSAAVTVANGSGVAGNPTLDLSTTGVTPGSYTNSNVTVDSQGRVTGIATGAASAQNLNLETIRYEEFMGNTNVFGSAITRTIAGAGATGTASTVGVDITEKAVGVHNLITGTTTNGRVTYAPDVDSAAAGYSALTCEIRYAVSSLGAVGQVCQSTLGFIDNTGTGADHVDGAYFRYNADGVGTVWECVTSAGSVRTSTTTAESVLVGQFQIFRVEINEAGTSVQFFINGVLVATHLTNIPSGTQRFAWGAKSINTAGTTSYVNYIDYLKFMSTWSAGR